MRNIIFLSIFILTSISAICQESELANIRASYSLGENTKKLIEQNDLKEIQSEFGETDKVDNLIAAIKSEKFKSAAYKLDTDMYFNPDINKYVFAIYSSKWIRTESQWGLSDYLFVIELIIDNDGLNNKPKVIRRRIVVESSDLKKWWQSLMDSYHEPKFQRAIWAEKYKLFPPPPPPPQTTAWLNKN